MPIECHNVYGTHNGFNAVPPAKAKGNDVIEVKLTKAQNGTFTLTDRSKLAPPTFSNLNETTAASEFKRLKKYYEAQGYKITTFCKP
jgi:hypothetical protein